MFQFREDFLSYVDKLSDNIKQDSSFVSAKTEVDNVFDTALNNFLNTGKYEGNVIDNAVDKLDIIVTNLQSIEDLRAALLPEEPIEADPENIKDYIDGSEQEKVWNLKLLQQYSRAFSVSDVS